MENTKTCYLYFTLMASTCIMLLVIFYTLENRKKDRYRKRPMTWIGWSEHLRMSSHWKSCWITVVWILEYWINLVWSGYCPASNVLLWAHLFSTKAKCSGKLLFFTPWYALVRGVKKCYFFGNICERTKWTQSEFTCSKLTIETLEQGVKYVQVNNKGTRTTPGVVLVFLL